MMVLPESLRIVALTTPVTFQMDVDGLVQLVRDVLREDPFSGNLFCFLNRPRDRVKLLAWDRNGFWVMSKRLERGRFQRLEGGVPGVEISREELIMLLEGIDTRTERFHRNFAREVRISARGNDDRPARAAR